MEADDQSPSSLKEDVADGANQKPNEIDSATNSEDRISGEGTSSQVTSSTVEAATEEKSPTKRNYRRRTENSNNDSSSDDDPVSNPIVGIAEVAQQQQDEVSDPEDVSLDELRVSNSDDEHNHNSRR